MTDEQSTGETYNRLHELIRDGVNDIVADKFDKIKSPLHLDILLSRVIEFATGVSADLQRQDGSDAAIACAAGCSLCCHNFEVHASPFEVLRIADHIVNRLPPGKNKHRMAQCLFSLVHCWTPRMGAAGFTTSGRWFVAGTIRSM